MKFLGFNKVECAASNIYAHQKDADITLNVKRWEPRDYLSDIVLLLFLVNPIRFP